QRPNYSCLSSNGINNIIIKGNFFATTHKSACSNFMLSTIYYIPKLRKCRNINNNSPVRDPSVLKRRLHCADRIAITRSKYHFNMTANINKPYSEALLSVGFEQFDGCTHNSFLVRMPLEETSIDRTRNLFGFIDNFGC